MAAMILIVCLAVIAILGGWWLKQERKNQKNDLIRQGKLAAGKFDEVVLPKKKPKKRKRKSERLSERKTVLGQRAQSAIHPEDYGPDDRQVDCVEYQLSDFLGHSCCLPHAQTTVIHRHHLCCYNGNRQDLCEYLSPSLLLRRQTVNK